MPVSYQCEADARLVVWTASDPVVADEWVQAMEELEKDPVANAMAPYAVIVDLRQRQSFDRGQMVRMLAARRRNRRQPTQRVAFLVSSAVAFGMVRMAEAYAAESIDARIFDDPVEARKWVLSPGDT